VDAADVRGLPAPIPAYTQFSGDWLVGADGSDCQASARGHIRRQTGSASRPFSRSQCPAQSVGGAPEPLPVVYEMRASWEDAAVDHGTTVEGSLRYRMSRALESFALRRADQVTTICEGLRGDIAARGVSADEDHRHSECGGCSRVQVRRRRRSGLAKQLGTLQRRHRARIRWVSMAMRACTCWSKRPGAFEASRPRRASVARGEAGRRKTSSRNRLTGRLAGPRHLHGPRSA
jgi:hypothetical protein